MLFLLRSPLEAVRCLMFPPIYVTCKCRTHHCLLLLIKSLFVIVFNWCYILNSALNVMDLKVILQKVYKIFMYFKIFNKYSEFMFWRIRFIDHADKYIRKIKKSVVKLRPFKTSYSLFDFINTHLTIQDWLSAVWLKENMFTYRVS